MRAFPIRLFHAFIFGLVLGTVLSIASLHIFPRVAAEETGSPPSGENPPSPPPSPVPSPSNAESDFDNDGLTAAQEQIAGTSPFGHWVVDQHIISNLPENISYSSGIAIRVMDVNAAGTAVLRIPIEDPATQGVRMTSWSYDVTSGLSQIAPDAVNYDVEVFDINDEGTAVGRMISRLDWTAKGFIWQNGATGDLVTPDSYSTAVAKRINNRGNWVGFEMTVYGGWTPVAVIDGQVWRNQDDPWSGPNSHFDGLSVQEMIGINENDQVLAAYYDYWNWTMSLAVVWNGHVENAGFPAPYLDSPSPWIYHEAVINNWGEFAAARMSGETCYYFDGDTNDFSGNEVHGVTDDGMVASAWGGWAQQQGVFLWSDGVEARIDTGSLLNISCHSAAISSNGIVIAADGYEPWIYIAYLDQDQDGDGMSDDWEQWVIRSIPGSNLTDIEPNDDLDGDGTNNLGEFLLRSDPNAAPVFDPDGNEIDTRPGIDTDGDGIPNVWEWENGLNYADPSDAPLDFDRDGYTNLQEYRLNTDPRGAPSYRIREPGPFADLSMGAGILGSGRPMETCLSQPDSSSQETLYFTAQLTAGSGQRAASWRHSYGSPSGALAFYPEDPDGESSYTNPLAIAPSGACISDSYNNPATFVYWANPTASPITLSQASTPFDIDYLYNPVFSPGGNYLVATCPGANAPIVWKMPTSPTETYEPVILTPPPDVSLYPWVNLSVNDHGWIVGNGITSDGRSVPILWSHDPTQNTVTSISLAPLDSGSWGETIGLTNHSDPLIAGTCGISGDQRRATVWTSDGTATDLGVLPNGNYSEIKAISPSGYLAGRVNTLVNGSLGYLPFIAAPTGGSSLAPPAPSNYRLIPQGAVSFDFWITAIADSGEVIGNLYQNSPAWRMIPTLWSHGAAHSLDSILPPSSGYALDSINSINSNGTLFARAWKDGASVTLLLTADQDTDGDGMPDAYENQHGFNAFAKADPTADSDSDGLCDHDEYRYSTEPRDADTDKDGMKDGWEVSWGFLPLDPSDAALDPDGDHVTNLRESQIGTIPTGTYKIETRLIDTDWTYPSVTAVGDTGQIIHTGQYSYDSGTQPDGMQYYSYSQDYSALPDSSSPGGTSSPLPPYSFSQSYLNDWSQYSGGYDSPAYYPDSATGTINGFIRSSSYSYDGANYNSTDTAFLLPDAANRSIEQYGIPWETIQNNLRSSLDSNGQPVLSYDETLYTYPEAVSSSGNQRIHRTSYYRVLMLDAEGGFLWELPGWDTWQTVNNLGMAATLIHTYVPETLEQPAHTVPEIRVFDTARTFPLPYTPGLNSNYSILNFSDDGRLLVSKGSLTTQGAWKTDFHLLDSTTGTMTRVRQPGLGMETIVSLSAKNQRLLGTGPKPFQITPDGTCIRLESLRIKNSPTDTPLPLADPSLYPGSLTPNHIASDGRITLTTTNISGQTVILQLAPSADADNDGVPDDWEMDFRAQIAQIFGPNDSPADASSYDVNHDYGNTGITAAGYFNHMAYNNGGTADHALFGMNTLYPSSWSDAGYMYYLNKKPVKFHSFVQGASCEGEGHFHSAENLDPNGYEKMTHTVSIDSTSENSLQTTTTDSEEETTAEVGDVKNFLQNTWPTEFPEYKRFWDATYKIKLKSTVTTDYKLAPTAAPDETKKKVETSDPSEKSWKPLTSISHNQTLEGQTPSIPTTIVETANDDTTTTTASSVHPVVNAWDVWALSFLDLDGFFDSATEWSMDYGDETEECKVSQPVAWRGLSNSAYDFAKSKAITNYFATNRTVISGHKSNYGTAGGYQKATWTIEGPEDRDHTLMIVKTYSKTESVGVSTTETKYRTITLKSKEKISITEEADPGDDWESVKVMLDLLPIEIKEVRFAGDDYHELKSDNCATIYSAPHWVDSDGDGEATTNPATGEKNYPVAFTQKTKPHIGALFQSSGLPNGIAIAIKATGPDFELPETAVTPAADGTITLPLTPSSKDLVDHIDFYDAADSSAFEINWQIKIGAEPWSTFGNTKHTVCITLAAPHGKLNKEYQESLFVIACRNAKGMTEASKATDGIWSEFTDREVKRVDGTVLKYYGSYNTDKMTTSELLKDGDGQCGAWADFFADLLKVHGIDHGNEGIHIVPANNSGVIDTGFLVRTWEASDHGTCEINGYPLWNIKANDFLNYPNNEYHWMYPDVVEFIDRDGLPGQGNKNPKSNFNQHIVVGIGGTFYDPSYGEKYNSLDDFDKKIFGFYFNGGYRISEVMIGADLDGDNEVENELLPWQDVMAVRLNPEGADVMEKEGENSKSDL